jgi:lauroyl/myristoyl acyltransferase
VRRVIRSIKCGYVDAAGLAGFHIWRRLARCLGAGGVCALARAFYLCRAMVNEAFKKPCPRGEEPEWLRVGGSLGFRIRRRQWRYLNDLLRNFPDRMAGPHWRSRCRMEGLEQLQAAQVAGRPVVLAFFHFGPIYTLRQWVRAYGFPAAAYLGGDLKSRGKLAQLQDRVTPFPEVPTVFFPHELRAVTKFVKGGNIIFVAMDLWEGRQTTAEVDGGWVMKLNTGAARLAHATGADLMLCSIVNEGFWRYRVKFGPRIPGESLRTEADWAEANRRLLEAMLPDFKAYPDQFILPIQWSRK